MLQAHIPRSSEVCVQRLKPLRGRPQDAVTCKESGVAQTDRLLLVDCSLKPATAGHCGESSRKAAFHSVLEEPKLIRANYSALISQGGRGTRYL